MSSEKKIVYAFITAFKIKWENVTANQFINQFESLSIQFEYEYKRAETFL